MRTFQAELILILVNSIRGCFKEYKIEADKQGVTHTLSDPGHCWSFCRTRFIGGAQEHQIASLFSCYCLENQPPKDYGKYSCKKCDFPRYTVCGLQGRYVAVYENVQHDDLNDPTKLSGTEEGHCLAYQTGNFFWSDCGNRFSAICYEDLPSSYIIHQGYIQEENNITTLYFQNQTGRLRALCDDVHSSTAIQTGNSNELKDDPDIPMVAVYVSVPAVVVIVAIATLAIFCRKRKLRAKDNSEPPDYVNSSQQAGVSIVHTDDLHLYETGISDDSHSHQYTALDHRSDNAPGAYTNVDHTYTNQQTSTENVYENK